MDSTERRNPFRQARNLPGSGVLVDDSAGDSAEQLGLCLFESFGGVRLLARRDRRLDGLDEGPDAADSRMVDGLASRVATNAFLGLRRIRHRSDASCRKMKMGAAQAAPAGALPTSRSLSGQSSSVLAVRAVEGRAAALDDAPDRSTAAARLTFAVIDRKTLRKITELAVGAGEILEGRAARRDRLGEHRVDCRDQPLQPLERNRPASAARMDAGAIERLADIDVAEAGDDSLVEQQQLDRGRAAGKAALEFIRVEVKRLWPERLERRPVGKPVGADQIKRPEPPRVVKRQPPALVRLDQEMVMLADLARVDPPVTRHAEMEAQSVAAVGVDQPVFRAAAEADDPLSRQSLAEVDRQRAAQVGPARLDPLDPAAVEHMGKAADGGFNFGKLGHRRDMAEPPQPR